MHILCYWDEPELNYQEAKQSLYELNIVNALAIAFYVAVWQGKAYAVILIFALHSLYLSTAYYFSRKARNLADGPMLRRAHIQGFAYRLLFLHIAIGLAFQLVRWHNVNAERNMAALKWLYLIGLSFNFGDIGRYVLKTKRCFRLKAKRREKLVKR